MESRGGTGKPTYRSGFAANEPAVPRSAGQVPVAREGGCYRSGGGALRQEPEGLVVPCPQAARCAVLLCLQRAAHHLGSAPEGPPGAGALRGSAEAAREWAGPASCMRPDGALLLAALRGRRRCFAALRGRHTLLLLLLAALMVVIIVLICLLSSARRSR